MLHSEFVNLNSITRICHVNLQKDGVCVGGWGQTHSSRGASRESRRVKAEVGGGGSPVVLECIAVYCIV